VFSKKRIILSTLAMWVIEVFFMWRAIVDIDNSYRPFAFIAGVLGLLLACGFTYAAPIMIRANNRVRESESPPSSNDQ
jgi:succinate-acetate transporter protein